MTKSIKGEIDGVSYTVLKPSRLAAAKYQTLWGEIIDYHTEKKVRIQLLKEDLERYVSLVVFTKVDGLQKVDGTQYAIPPFEASTEEHMEAYWWFLDTDDEVIDAIVTAMHQVSKASAPKHILPPEDLTDEDRADPNSSSGGKSTKTD